VKRVALLVALVSLPASAKGAPRGWLTGAGVMLAAGGAVAISGGAYDSAQAESAAFAVRAYYANGAAPTSAEASTVRWLHERSERLSGQGLGLLIGGVAAAVVGIGLVLLDGWLGGTSVSLSIQPARTSVHVGGTF
jgi:hypothetical protein